MAGVSGVLNDFGGLAGGGVGFSVPISNTIVNGAIVHEL